jgi:hypothetical protein
MSTTLYLILPLSLQAGHMICFMFMLSYVIPVCLRLRLCLCHISVSNHPFNFERSCLFLTSLVYNEHNLIVSFISLPSQSLSFIVQQ